MSILINMEMPTSCAKCKLFGEYGCPFIGAVGYALTRGERNADCPLVPIPPHGRLIDADALPFEKCEYADGSPVWLIEKRDVDSAPTIIPAEDLAKTIGKSQDSHEKTNADRIRAMSDEELAEWFSSIAEEAVKSGGKIKSSCWLDWLQKGVVE